MSQILDELVTLLALEQIEVNLFRGQSQDLGWGTVYGGQVLGQALSAAVQTVPIDRHVHSLHGYFLRPGAVDKPIVYEVDRIRDGGSFTTRRVVAIQNGKAIFSLGASFQIAEQGFEHQDEMPEAPEPLSVPTQQELAAVYADQLPEFLRSQALANRPFEMRPIEEPSNPLRARSEITCPQGAELRREGEARGGSVPGVLDRRATKPSGGSAVHCGQVISERVLEPEKRPPARMFWLKANGTLPDDPALHRYLLAYASDFAFLTTAMLPHGVSWLSRGMQVASLDHSMWFHEDVRVDEWLLHVVDSPNAHGGRGLVRGRVFTHDGRLVASTAQEGLIRRRSTGKG